jgi:uroporphyrin-III C-methyltransferase
MPGRVYLVGAGPGDPELLTVKAHRLIRTAEVILYDRLVGEGVIGLASPSAVKIPVGKQPGTQEATQKRVLWLMVAYARSGRTVVRLKGGDPFVFGRGGEEWSYLSRKRIPVEVVPGISSALALPALAGIPLTHRGISSSFAVVTGRREEGLSSNWEGYQGVGTLVILMGVTDRDQIARELITAGRAPTTPAAFIERGSTHRERVIVTTLAEIAARSVQVAAPAVLVVGDVVNVRQTVAIGGIDARLTRGEVVTPAMGAFHRLGYDWIMTSYFSPASCAVASTQSAPSQTKKKSVPQAQRFPQM